MVKFSQGSNFRFYAMAFILQEIQYAQIIRYFFFKFKSRKMTDAKKVHIFSKFFATPPPWIYGFLSIVCGIIDAYLQGKSESSSRGWWVLFVL